LLQGILLDFLLLDLGSDAQIDLNSILFHGEVKA